MRAFFSALSLVAVFANPALADLAPEPGYVEQCTIKNHEGPDTSCTSCRASFKDRDGCAGLMGPQGYTRACRTRGASVWTEVWCKAKDGARPAPTPPTEPTPSPEPAPTPTPTPVEPKQQAGDAVSRDAAPTPPAETPEPKAPIEVKAADVQPKRDGKCGAGGFATGLPLLVAAMTLALRRGRSPLRSLASPGLLRRRRDLA